MKNVLGILAVLLLGVSLATWLALGANRGWTHTSEAVKIADPVTGIEGIEYRRCFRPGLDFLGASLLGAVILAGISRFPKNKTTN